MHRRDYLRSCAAGLAAAWLRPGSLVAGDPTTVFDRYFIEVLEGFLRNARRTSPSFAVCDFPDGTILKNCVAKSGKTYIGVARMLPAMAAWVAAGRKPARFGPERLELREVLKQAFRNAFNPEHPDYWEEPPSDRPSQRQVEACLVAWALYLLGDRFLAELTSRDRVNIQAWLASCTRLPERKNNHAWFHAINNATRLVLSGRWKEFQGDEAYMKEDLKALDSLGSPGDGWYSDSPALQIFDYYNFFTFPSHFLVWNQIAGSRYPELARPFLDRLRLFLDKAPYFFAGHGGHVLFGRSLIYRWAVLMPLVLAYRQKLWPHSPGLLRRIVRRNLEWHWGLGAYDSERGKLRETFSADGTPEIREAYVDNGHPYWTMLTFPFLAIPAADPFWTAVEEPLPVERGDFVVRFDGPRMLLAGTKTSGQVRWLQSQNTHYRAYYRDRYIKFSYSSHFPFNILSEADRAPWDSTLVFRNPATGHVAARSGVQSGKLRGDGVEVEWWAELDGMKFEVASRVLVSGEFEHRSHTVKAPAEAIQAGVEVIEGSAPLGLKKGEAFEQAREARCLLLRSRDGRLVATWNAGGYETLEVAQSFEETGRRNVNIVHAECAVNTLRGKLASQRAVFASLHYASPAPMNRADILRRAAELMAGPGT